MKVVLKEKCRELGLAAGRKDASQLLQLVSKKQREDNEYNPYRILASLPIKIYISANPDNLLEQALIDQGKNPQVLVNCWNSKMRENPQVVEKLNSLERPISEKPLLYHMFGQMEDRSSWVLTEDDYFEYLMWINKPDNIIPDFIKNAWKLNPLLFLGFKVSDWKFRLLYRSILTRDRRREIDPEPEFHSIAVQIQPGDDNLRPEGARKFLTQYFPSGRFNLFWGSAENFLTALWDQWKLELEDEE